MGLSCAGTSEDSRHTDTDTKMTGGEAANEKMREAANEKTETKVEKVDGKEKKEVQQEYKFNAKPDEKKGLEGFMQFLWNTETNEFLGRTGMSWLKIGIFYIIYYTFLAGFFMLMLLVFFQTLKDDRPSWDVDSDSIIGKNPGVGYRPMPPEKFIESTLIWFRDGNYNGNWDHWVDRLEEHVKDYKNDSYASALGDEYKGIECGELAQNKPGENNQFCKINKSEIFQGRCNSKNKYGSGENNQFCKINKSEIFQGSCNSKNKYGFPQGKPCILIKLNKIYGWKPEPYQNVTEFPHYASQALKDDFEKNEAEGNEALNNRVWFECVGENPADKENLGPITYFPTNGVSANYYPYTNQKGYLSPIVFIQLDKPKGGVMIAVECKAYARNIDHDSMERKGLAHFELMID